jgi:protein-S-isoprenylcysteine O-methyltransferase Ste14
MTGMRRITVLAYGVGCYLAFAGSFLAIALFGWNAGVVRGIDAAPRGSLALDLALIAVFGVSHSVLARPAAKRIVSAVVSEAAERSTYVLVASASLALLVWQWRAQPAVVWHIATPAIRDLVWALGVGCAGIILWSTFLTDHFDLFGLRQVWLAFRGRRYTPVPFVERGLYRWVRHPMMTGLLGWLWLVPDMSTGHAVFSAGMTAYILVGVAYEERGLARSLGQPYEAYRRRVGKFLPLRR